MVKVILIFCAVSLPKILLRVSSFFGTVSVQKMVNRVSSFLTHWFMLANQTHALYESDYRRRP